MTPTQPLPEFVARRVVSRIEVERVKILFDGYDDSDLEVLAALRGTGWRVVYGLPMQQDQACWIIEREVREVTSP